MGGFRVAQMVDDEKDPEVAHKGEGAEHIRNGRPQDLHNYRPIYLSMAMYKVYTVVFKRRLMKALDDALQEVTHSSGPGRPTVHPTQCSALGG